MKLKTQYPQLTDGLASQHCYMIICFYSRPVGNICGPNLTGLALQNIVFGPDSYCHLIGTSHRGLLEPRQPLVLQLDHNKSLPDWAGRWGNTTVYEQACQVSDYQFTLKFDYDHKMQRLRGGEVV